MRPLKLTLRAFGPFAGEQSVDFTSGGDNPFLLINGPTGAGKTSLLDGLCYALYGTASGEVRTERYLRSQLAAPEAECQVSLRFSVGGKLYFIERRPTQFVLSRGKNVERKHSVSLCEVDADEKVLGERLTKINEVEARIVELIGFTCDQFRQVVVLPQGEFRKLLLSKSDEKEKILEKLFGAGRFKLVEEALRRRRSDLNSQLAGLNSGRESLLNSLSATSVEEVEARRAGLTVREREIQAALLTVRAELAEAQARQERGRVVEAAFAEREAADAAVAKLAARQPQVDEDSRRAERAFRAQTLEDLEQSIAQAVRGAQGRATSLAGLATELATLTLQRQGAVAALEAARQEQAKGQERIAERTRLEARLVRLRELAEARKRVAAAQVVVDRTRTAAEVAAAGLDQLDRRQAELSGQIEALSVQSAEAARLELEISRLEGLAATHARLAGLLVETGAAQATLDAALGQVAQRAATLEEARENRLRVQRSLIAGQAARMAQSLTPGSACPVCGATDHPSPAHASLDVAQVGASEEDLQRAEAAVMNLERALRAEQERCEGCRGTLAGLTSGVEHCRAALAEPGQQVQEPGELTQALEAARAAHKQAQAAGVRLRTSQTERTTLTDRREAMRTASENATAAHTAATTALAEAQALLTRAVAEAGEGDEASVLAQVAQLTTALQRAEAALKVAETTLRGVESALSTRRGEQLRLAQQDAEEAEALVELRKAFDVRLLTEGFDSEDDYRKAKLPRAQAEALRNAVAAHGQAVAAVRSRQERAVAAFAGLGLESAPSELAPARPDMAALDAAKTQAEATLAGLNREAGQIQSQVQNLTSALNALEEKAGRSRELEADYAVVGRLADMVSGSNPLRMTLQRYVLAALFEEVARAASERLVRMSRGRYQLVRSGSTQDARHTGGLDLDVTDAQTGETRPATSLSGGETFLASLALALGLSDVVMAQQGGRSLECIFIDEGFGALDGETLEFALNTLMELHSAGRLIGIISHVAELKERIEARIDVLPGKTGSTLRQVNC